MISDVLDNRHNQESTFSYIFVFSIDNMYYITIKASVFDFMWKFYFLTLIT